MGISVLTQKGLCTKIPSSSVGSMCSHYRQRFDMATAHTSCEMQEVKSRRLDR